MFPIPADPLAQSLLLNALPGVGPATVRRLRDAFGGDLAAALRANLRKRKGLGDAGDPARSQHPSQAEKPD